MTGCSRHDATVVKSASPDSAKSSDSAGAAVKYVAMLSYEQRQGKFVYDKYCAVCHGVEGAGDGFNSFNLDPKPGDLTDPHFMKSFDDRALFEIIARGGKSLNKSSLMPGYDGTLKKEEVQYVVDYVRQLSSTSSPRQ